MRHYCQREQQAQQHPSGNNSFIEIYLRLLGAKFSNPNARHSLGELKS
jgi:hypothetical protein